MMSVKLRRVHLAFFGLLLALGSASADGAALATVSGVVCDSTGTPQIGATVELLLPDLNVVATVYTDNHGRFVIPKVSPGHYSLKAMGASFLPSLRENLRIRSNTVVNLTLNTLFEVVQWLPATPRDPKGQKDDWDWTLRSAANRPLLRWLEDGPLVVVSDGTGARPKLRARLMATGQEGTFGESGERFSATVEETPSDSRELLARVDFDPRTDEGMESMLGFRQDLGYAGAVQSVAAVSVQPEVSSDDADDLEEIAFRTQETMNLGDEFDLEAGSDQVLARFGQRGANTVAAALPFAGIGWHDGNSTVRYRMATAPPSSALGETQAGYWLPRLSAGNGQLAIEHGLHQELGWERQTDASGVAVLLYSDRIDHPALEAMSRFAAGDADTALALVDNSSGLMRITGQDYSEAGLTAAAERRFHNGVQFRVSYASGKALTLASHAASGAAGTSTTRLLTATRTRAAQSYSLSLSGTLEGTGTHWQATYRWQPDETLTPVAVYMQNAAAPYMSLHLRQPIHRRGDGGWGMEAQFDLCNLLAEGYHPIVTSNGSVLVFAQTPRNFGGGLAFTF